MITYFYKILYDNKDVVYVGVTTRTIQDRFKQHIKSKQLDNHYSVVGFDKIIHPDIKSLDDYYKEYKKVAYLEKKYIKEERNKGSNLLNISSGGEWGGAILNKLLKKDFLRKHGSYDGYEIYRKRIIKFKSWMNMWIRHTSENPTHVWLKSWKFVKTRSKTRLWIRHWIEHRSESKILVWLYHWIEHRSETRFKVWMFNWVARRSRDGKIIK